MTRYPGEIAFVAGLQKTDCNIVQPDNSWEVYIRGHEARQKISSVYYLRRFVHFFLAP